MEAASPICESLEQEIKIKLDNYKTFEIKTNEINFNLKISYNENYLFFEIDKQNDFPKNKYNKIFNLDELGKINKFFLQFEYTIEVINVIGSIIQNNKLSILEEKNQMKIQIINPVNQKIINLDLPQKKKNIKDELNNIIPFISSLNNRVGQLEKDYEKKSQEYEKQSKELALFKNKYETLEKKLNELIQLKDIYEKQEKELTLLKNNFDLLEKQIMRTRSENKYFKESSIIKQEDEEMIYNWFKIKPSRFTKLLDSKIDGDSTKTFIDKCASKSPTIVFIKTKRGFRFGGFTSIIWKYDWGNDDKSFLFSLDRKEKYDIQHRNYAKFLSNEFFQFGGPDLRIYNNCE